MNSLIEGINVIASVWWSWSLYALWQGALLLLAVVAVCSLRRRITPNVRYALLFLVLVKFLLPPLGPNGLNLYEWALRALWASEEATSSNALLDGISSFESYAVVSVKTPASLDPLPARLREGSLASFSLAAKLLMVHLAAGFALSVWVLLQVVRFRRRLGRARHVASGECFDLCAALAGEIGLERPPRLLMEESGTSPLAGGVFRPYVLLPQWVEGSTPEERRTLLAHELAHIKRRDPLLNWFQIASQIWLWWNPLAWWVNARIRAERELCCDDLVLSLRFADGANYSRVLVRVAERFTNCGRVLEAMGLADSFRRTRRRILRALDETLPRGEKLSAASVSALLLVAVLVLPGAKSAESEAPLNQARNAPVAQAEVSSATATQIQMECRLLEFKTETEDARKQFVELTDTYGPLSGPLDTRVDELEAKLSDLTRRGELNALSAPKILIHSGQQGSIRVGEEIRYIASYEPVAGAVSAVTPVIETEEVGFVFEATPTWTEDGTIDLSFLARQTELEARESILNPNTGREEDAGRPILSQFERESRVRLKEGETLFVGLMNEEGNDRALAMVVTARMHKGAGNEEKPDKPSRAPTDGIGE